MPKPQWLVETEMRQNRPKPPTCGSCAHLGRFDHWSRWFGRKRLEVYECDIHPGCLNTVECYICSDYEKKSLML